jgi:hypothetical protein
MNWQEKRRVMANRDFYEFLREKHGTLERAISWAILWAKDQPVLPEFGGFSLRAMAFHISMAFEGKMSSDYDQPCTFYLGTEYGPRIFEAMCTGRDDWPE